MFEVFKWLGDFHETVHFYRLAFFHHLKKDHTKRGKRHSAVHKNAHKYSRLFDNMNHPTHSF